MHLCGSSSHGAWWKRALPSLQVLLFHEIGGWCLSSCGKPPGASYMYFHVIPPGVPDKAGACGERDILIIRQGDSMTLVTCSGFQLMQACLAALPFPHTPLLKWDRRQGCRYWARKGWSYFPLGEKQDPLYQSFKSIFFHSIMCIRVSLWQNI